MKGVRAIETRQYRAPSGNRIVQVIIPARKAHERVAQGDQYRKPTQVGEERILRCSSESRLRN